MQLFPTFSLTSCHATPPTESHRDECSEQNMQSCYLGTSSAACWPVYLPYLHLYPMASSGPVARTQELNYELEKEIVVESTDLGSIKGDES